jgi:hypothetical protein
MAKERRSPGRGSPFWLLLTKKDPIVCVASTEILRVIYIANGW